MKWALESRESMSHLILIRLIFHSFGLFFLLSLIVWNNGMPDQISLKLCNEYRVIVLRSILYLSYITIRSVGPFLRDKLKDGLTDFIKFSNLYLYFFIGVISYTFPEFCSLQWGFRSKSKAPLKYGCDINYIGNNNN